MNSKQRGGVHVIVAIVVIVVMLGLLSFLVYKVFMTEKSKPKIETESTSSEESEPTKGFTIVNSSGVLGKKYINYDYGISFEFPERSIQPLTCEVSYVWKDKLGNDISAPLHYVSSDRPADMSVVTDGNVISVVPKTAPFYATAKHPSGTEYNTSCELRDVTARDVAEGAPVESRTWEIGRAKTKDRIASAIDSMPTFKHRKVSYTIGESEGVRSPLVITVEGEESIEAEAEAKYLAWYYPDNELVVYINLGDEKAFRNPSSPENSYLADIVNSFQIYHE